MQRIQADFAELEQFEQHAQRAIDEIEHQFTDLAGFLAPLHEGVDGVGCAGVGRLPAALGRRSGRPAGQPG
jgi:hypothetical protein